MAFTEDIGVDLGTSTVLVYICGKGIVLNEASVVAVNRDNGEILAIGEDAKGMLGRTPGNIAAIRPLMDGVISDYDIAERMLKHFIKKACGAGRFFKPRIMVCIPSGVSEVERRAVREAVVQAGGKAVYLIEEPLAAAIGVGLDISKPEGTMMVDIGGGTTDIAVISMNAIVASTSTKVAGDKIDEAIARYLRKEHRLYVGERTAEQIKINIGSACLQEEQKTMLCRGRDLVTGLPEAVELTSADVLEAMQDPLNVICEAIHEVLKTVPPELAADIGSGGIVLTGGGALLHNMDRLISVRTGIDVALAENPMECVAIGTAKALQNVARFSNDYNSTSVRKPY